MSLQNKCFSPEFATKMGKWVLGSLLVFTLGLVAASFFAGIEEIINSIKELSLILLLAVIGFALANYVAHWLIWAILFKQLGVNIPLRKLALYYIAGSALLPTPGKVGTAIRVYFLKKNHGVRYVKSAAVMFMDMLTDLISVVGIMLICGFFWVSAKALLMAGMVLLMAGVYLLSYPVLLVKIIKAIYAILGKRQAKFFAGVISTIRHIQILLKPKSLWLTITVSTLGWLTVCASFWLVLMGMGQQIPFYMAAFIAVFAILVGIVSMLPGGIGGTEAVMITMLISIDIPAPTAVAATVVTRFAVLWTPILIGFVALPFALKESK